MSACILVQVAFSSQFRYLKPMREAYRSKRETPRAHTPLLSLTVYARTASVPLPLRLALACS